MKEIILLLMSCQAAEICNTSTLMFGEELFIDWVLYNLMVYSVYLNHNHFTNYLIKA